MIPQVDDVIPHEKGYELEVEENTFNASAIVVTQEQFAPLRRQLSKQYSAKELPCPILVLSDSFDSFDVSGYRNYTLDAFPTHAITPEILTYLLNTLKRDFRKDIRLKRLAHYDALTGACNRHLFSDRAKQAISAARRQQECLSFMYFDLDKFKQVNDKYGHLVGDKYLKAFVEVVNKNIRDMDTLGRLGGDEFGLLLPKLDKANALKMAQRTLKALKMPQEIGDQKLRIGASIGIVSFGSEEEMDQLTYKNLIEFGDTALFEAKKKPGSQVQSYNFATKTTKKQKVAA